MRFSFISFQCLGSCFFAIRGYSYMSIAPGDSDGDSSSDVASQEPVDTATWNSMIEDPTQEKASAAEGTVEDLSTMKTPASNRPDFWGAPVVDTPEKEISVGSCSLVFSGFILCSPLSSCLPLSKRPYVNYVKF